MNQRVVNLTGHPIVVEFDGDKKIRFPANGEGLRLPTDEKTEQFDVMVEGSTYSIGVARKRYKRESAPPVIPGTIYIVSNTVCKLYNREDFVAPDTKPKSGVKKDDNGRIISVRRFRGLDELVEDLGDKFVVESEEED